jgi:asparagine N-glycosylation enzyme membrane subunit Stt3
VVARLAMLLTWHGSLLYLAVAELTAVAVLAGAGRQRALLAEAVGAAATALLVLPFVAGREPTLGGPFSPIELSRLHVAALLGVAATAALAAGLGWRLSAASVPRRLLGLAAVGLLIAGLGLVLIPGLLEGLQHAFDYAAKETRWIAGNTENQPIFRHGSPEVAVFLFGGFAFLVPVSPLGPLARARDPRLRGPALIVASFTAVFGALALQQSRYVSDFAPVGSVALVLLLSETVGFVARRVPSAPRWLRALPAVAGLLLLWPLISTHAARVPTALAALLGEPAPGARRTPHATVHRFARLVREATPETSGYFDPTLTPEYGVLSFAGIGHVFQRVARRPTPADNFGPYLAGSNLAAASRFYKLADEREAVAWSKRFQWRYVVTAAASRPPPEMLLHRLHWADGTGRFGAPRLEHFRLVTEGPRRGISIGTLRDPRPPGDVPYKLFEVVPGALLQVPSEPGSSVVAEVEVVTPIGRRFSYRATGDADSRGVAELRVPYATDTEAPAHPLAPYRVSAGERVYAVAVSDAQVQDGAVIALSAE